MGRYVARRLVVAVPTLIALSFFVFGLISLAPGDPAEELARRRSPAGIATPAEIAEARRELGLERPFLAQYRSWITGAVTGDLGRSFARRTPVWDEVRDRFPATAQLAAVAFVVIVVAGGSFGTIAALLHRRWPDQFLRVGALVGASVPSFFLAYLLISVFATRLHLLPVAGRQEAASVVLPSVALAASSTAIVSRILRSSLLEVLGEDYVRAARAKGLRFSWVIVRHALRNAAIPVVTLLGWILGLLLEGAIIIEVIFAWPGLGQLTYEAIAQRDYPMVQGLILLAGTGYVVLNLLVDVSYAVLDPRIRAGETR